MKTSRAAYLFLPFFLLLNSCFTVPETGRSALRLFPESLMVSMATQAYADETGKFPEVTGTADAEMVQRVGHRIAKASGKNYDWEFKLLNAPDVVNAYAMPGGKVAVYTGILRVTQDEDGLAAVLGHEVAHATSGHGNERMSQNVLVQLTMLGATVGLEEWTNMDGGTKAAIVAALSGGSQLGVLLPFSRLHESEADEIGLRYAIRAGYNPNAAPLLWERMAKLNPERGPEMLSTHPDPMNRAKRLRQLIPKLVQEESRR